MYIIPLAKHIYSSSFILDSFSVPVDAKYFIEDITQQIEKKDFPLAYRKTLHDVIKAQYKRTGIEPPFQCDYILEDNCYTITTGHQLCLFGGPQLFIHKIISVLKIVEVLKSALPDFHFVPVFWMASEDHDFKEISELNIFNNTISIEGENTGPVGRIKTQVFEPALIELLNLFKNDHRGNELTSIFKEAFKREYWSDCSRYWISNLFSEKGLIVLDADEPNLKAIFSSVLKKEIEDQFSYKLVSQQNDKLKVKGYDLQVFPREINLFYIENDQRKRIVFNNNDQFEIGSTVFSKNQLLQKLKNNPENFSPNVVLRPLFQEMILPNLVYVGGPSEITYWAQLVKAFEEAEILYPRLILRDSFAWIKKSDLEWWTKQKLTIEDIFLDFDKLVKRIYFDDVSDSFYNNLEISNFENQLRKKINEVDTSLIQMLNSELTKFRKALEKIQKKLIANSKKKNDIYYNRVKKIQSSIMKNNVLNERKDSFIQNYIDLGENYIEKLMEESSPLSFSLKIIVKD